MNYREKMREYIECPQFGSINYGKWGSLNIEQRKLIKRLLDEMDRADEVIKKQFFELDKYKIVLDKIKEYIENNKYKKMGGYGDNEDEDIEVCLFEDDIWKLEELLEEIE